MDPSTPKFVEAYRASTLPEAHALRLDLEEAGIPVRIDGDQLRSAIRETPMGTNASIRILVEESQLPLARRILDDANERDGVEGNQLRESEIRISSEPKYVEVYRARNLPQAHAIRLDLDEAGIPARIDGELLQGAVGELPMGWDTAPRILVEESHLPKARRIIDEVENREIANARREGIREGSNCLSCEQPMEDWEVKCRWCGWSFAKETAQSEPGAETEAGDEAEASAALQVASQSSKIGWFLVFVGFVGGSAAAVWYFTPEDYFALGVEAYERRAYGVAIACFTKEIQNDPNNIGALTNRGLAHYYKGNYEAALADSFRVLRLKADDSVGHYLRGIAYRKKGDYVRASSDLTATIQLDPKNAHGYESLAWLLATCPDEKHRDGKKAVECATEACELTNWKDLDKFDTLAAAYAEAGDFDKAVECQQKSLHSPRFSQQDTDRDRDHARAQSRLQMYRDKQPYREK